MLPKTAGEVVKSHKEIPENKAGVLVNSQGLLKIAANRKSAKELLRLALGDNLLVHKL
jgi:S-adenosylmethionine hydrolase